MMSGPNLVRVSVPRAYYWLLVVFSVNVPGGIIRFDRSGLTHHYALLNAQSISRIALFLICATATIWLIAKSGSGPLRNRDIRRALKPVLLIFAIFTTTSVLVSPERLLSLYRLAEWGLVTILVAGVLHHVTGSDLPDFVALLIYRISTIPIVMVSLALLLPTDVAYYAEDSISGNTIYRLGGSVVYPNVLGVLAGFAFFYCFLYYKASKRVLCCFFYLLVVALTYSRGAMLGVISAGLVLALVKASRAQLIAITCALCLFVGIGASYSEKVIDIASRGQGIENLEKLSDRVGVWIAALEMIHEHPIFGYGFVAGSKDNLLQFTEAAWWVPPHAHNEFLEAGIGGGITAALGLLLLYVKTSIDAYMGQRSGRPSATLLLLIFVQCGVYALQTPILSNTLSSLGAIGLVVIVATRSGPAHRFVKQRVAQEAHSEQ